MDFELKRLRPQDIAAAKVEALLVLVSSDFRAGKDAISTLTQDLFERQHWKADAGTTLSMYRAPDLASRWVVLAGMSNGSRKAQRSGVYAAMSELRRLRVKSILVCVAGAEEPQGWVGAVTQALLESSYNYATTRSPSDACMLKRITIATRDEVKARLAFTQALAVGAGINLAREWGNRPGNHATPTLLADVAKSLAAKSRLTRCEVLGPKEVARLGMGAFQAVAGGSAEALRFIVLEYRGGPKSQPPVVLIGKGITFDSGGISLKPAADMDEMKFDMCGAASVLGVFRALNDLKPKINVVGLIPACENLPGSRAVKPGDVVISMSGQTIEILNTDAEGRLVLCDALTYAQRFKPRAMIDIATLTGACVIALGGVRSGMFSVDDALASALVQAGEVSGDLCWRMPLDDEYAEGLKTNFADVANIAGRAAGAVTAAKFLQKFIGDTPWAHLDIAGTAWLSGKAKGATGRPVGLLLQYLLGQQSDADTSSAKTHKKVRQ